MFHSPASLSYPQREALTMFDVCSMWCKRLPSDKYIVCLCWPSENVRCLAASVFKTLRFWPGKINLARGLRVKSELQLCILVLEESGRSLDSQGTSIFRWRPADSRLCACFMTVSVEHQPGKSLYLGASGMHWAAIYSNKGSVQTP